MLFSCAPGYIESSDPIWTKKETLGLSMEVYMLLHKMLEFVPTETKSNHRSHPCPVGMENLLLQPTFLA